MNTDAAAGAAGSAGASGFADPFESVGTVAGGRPAIGETRSVVAGARFTTAGGDEAAVEGEGRDAGSWRLTEDEPLAAFAVTAFAVEALGAARFFGFAGSLGVSSTSSASTSSASPSAARSDAGLSGNDV